MIQLKPRVAAKLPEAPTLEKLAHFVHRWFLPLLIGSYVCAAFVPHLGLWLHGITLARLPISSTNHLTLTPSMLMLAILLFNSGVGVKSGELKHIIERPLTIALGTLANIAVPVLLVFCFRQALSSWHNTNETQTLLMGLGLIASMPIAGSSCAWSQNANGNVSLSLGLIFLSTLLSPLTTPAVLKFFADITTGSYSAGLAELATAGTNLFMLIAVVLPSVLGLAMHFVIGAERAQKSKTHLKLTNMVVLLLLNYANAAISLPAVVRNPDWDFMLYILIATGIMCMSGFVAGWGLSKALPCDRSDRASLMFALGMNNNGSGLVLATAALAVHTTAILPLIIYTLLQQVAAACVDWWISGRNE